MNLHDVFSFIKNHGEMFTKPYITVARQPGSGGKLIAQALAKDLGYTFLDEEIIEAIADNTRKRRAIVKAVEERSRTRIEDIVHALFNPEYMDDYLYIRELAKVMLAYMHKGHVVILGRGGNFISPPNSGLHVNIVAPFELRVERAVLYEKLDKATAKRRVAKVTAEREAFAQQYFKKAVWESEHYDLTISTQVFSIESAKKIIIDAFYEKFPASKRYSALFQS
jgi:cytidylate kinase